MLHCNSSRHLRSSRGHQLRWRLRCEAVARPGNSIPPKGIPTAVPTTDAARTLRLLDIQPHSFDQFVTLLAQHCIEHLADVRRFPGSRKHPQFNRDSLAVELPKAGVGNCWIEALGGRRPKAISPSSQNLGLRTESFRGNCGDLRRMTLRQEACRPMTRSVAFAVDDAF